MSTRYLLPCDCGATVPVAASQAGGSVPCPGCARSIEAPRLRDLQALPIDQASTAPTGSRWGFRQGVIAATLLTSLLLAAGGAWYLVQEPAPPTPFDPTLRREAVEAGLDGVTPNRLLAMYYDIYRPMSQQGIPQAKSPADQIIQSRIAWCRMYRTGLWTAAGIVLAAGLTTAALARGAPAE